MKDKLVEYCSKLNIDLVGIAPIGPYWELGERLKARVETNQLTGFEEQDINLRIDPRLTMPEVKSVIVCLFPYYIGEVEESNISKYTYGKDYHLVIKEKLNKIGEFLSDSINGFSFKSYADIGPMSDRYLAYLAGLGYFGINSHIITDKYGSYVLIGYILNNYPFEPDKPLDKTCKKCGACVRECPGQIILGNFDIDPRMCRSYITQIKRDLTKEEIEILQKTNLVYGCDICQDVCPHNIEIEATIIDEFKKELIYNLEEKELRSISNKEFTRRYRNRAFSWRGRKILLRNFDYINKNRK